MPRNVSQKTTRWERMKASTTLMTLEISMLKYIMVHHKVHILFWYKKMINSTLGLQRLFFFLSVFNVSYSTLYLNNSPFLNLQSWIFSTLTCKVTLASSRLRFGVQMSALNIIFWPSSLSHNVQNLDNGCYLEMSHLDVTKVFYHSAGAHAMNQQQHERCSVTLWYSVLLYRMTQCQR